MMWIGVAMMLLYLGGNTYVFIRLWQLLQPAPMWCRVTFAALFLFAVLALFVAMVLRHASLPVWVHRVLFGVGSVWLVFLLYMVLTTALFDVAHLIFPSLKYGVLYALGATTLLLVCGYVNYRLPRVERVVVPTTKHLEDDYRIVMVSDVHLGYGTTKRDMERYVRLINEQRGDVVVIVGDLIDNSVVPIAAEDMCRMFDDVVAPDGIYMVAGNHEYISGIEACEEYLASTSVRLVRDSVVTLPSGVQLICRDDRSNRRRATIDSLLQGVDMSRPTVVLDHQPYDVEAATRRGVDIYLAGHTHRGQVWPLTWLTDAMYAQSHGHRVWGSSHVIVSMGLSLWGPPFRIGTHSEIFNIEINEESE
ncbi:MAG: metallophosphoesterase [Alistipes sp.]|nr:metallophosphoesterase [Alistipes sp.]